MKNLHLDKLITIALTTIFLTGCKKDVDLTPAPAPVTPTAPTPVTPTITPQIMINEFMAKNTSIVCPDSAGGTYSTADWIEIYNPTDASIDIAGYYISDSIPDKQKFQIASGNPSKTTIPSKGRLIIWCDDLSNLGILHTNFKLSSSGEQIGLFKSDGTVCDTITFTQQTSDISYGRLPDGGTTWKFFNTPTLGLSNQ